MHGRTSSGGGQQGEAWGQRDGMGAPCDESVNFLGDHTLAPWVSALARSLECTRRPHASDKCYGERISRSGILCGRVLLQPDTVSGSVQPDTKRQTTKPRMHVRGQGRGMHAPLECTPCGRPCHGRRRATESALHESCLAIARVSCFCHHHHHHPQSAPRG